MVKTQKQSKYTRLLTQSADHSHLRALHSLDSLLFHAAVDFFTTTINATRCNVPLTTLMISSPGEVFKGQQKSPIDYTTDTLPITIPDRFGTGKTVYLAESAQLYLELMCSYGADHVYAIYNSFRKEKADRCHLSEFQHIEYEGKNDLAGCQFVAEGLLDHLRGVVFGHQGSKSLQYFLTDEQIAHKQMMAKKGWEVVSFVDAMEILYKDSSDSKYKEVSMRHFGSEEERRLTEILDAHVRVDSMPMLEIPFYHDVAEHDYKGIPLAKNSDYILHGYRETIGLGQRIKNKDVLMHKAQLFNLPAEDYGPYLVTRNNPKYKQTSGFGLGLQRLVHRLTDVEHIAQATVFPRTHLVPNP